MVKLGPNTYPGWRKGSVPSVEEWQLLFSQKLDSDRVMEEFSSAINTASPQQISALVSILLPVLTEPINNEVIPATLRNYATIASLQEEIQRAESAENKLQPAGDYVTTASLQQEVARAEAAEGAIFQLPAWVPIPCPLTMAPAGFLPGDGRSFNTSQYPQLAQGYPNGALPDLRGMFIRGLDATGNVDNYPGGNRHVLSREEGSYVFRDPGSAVANFAGMGEAGGAAASTDNSLTGLNWDVQSDLSVVKEYAYSFGNESLTGTLNGTYNGRIGVTRPKNVAYNYIFRAA